MANIPQFVISIFAGILVLAFQNCSAVGPESVKTGVSTSITTPENR